MKVFYVKKEEMMKTLWRYTIIDYENEHGEYPNGKFPDKVKIKFRISIGSSLYYKIEDLEGNTIIDWKNECGTSTSNLRYTWNIDNKIKVEYKKKE